MKKFFQITAQITSLTVLAGMLIGCTPSTTHDDDHKDHHHEETHIEDNHTEAVHESGDDHDDHEDHAEGNEGGSTIRQAGSHVHGDAVLAIALDDSTLVIELETPLYNIVGFERAPDTDAERESLIKAQRVLYEPSKLFELASDANCVAAKTDRSLTVFDELLKDHDDHDEHHSDDGEDHREVIVEYVYSCANPDKLSFVKTELFTLFSNLSELDAVYLGPNIQKQVTLKPGNNRLSLTR